MTGDELMWYELAYHQSLPISIVKKLTTSKQFAKWCYFLNKKKTEREKIDFYLAQIAMEVRRSFVKNPNKVRLDEFVFDFEAVDEYEKRQKRIVDSKRFWLGGLGLMDKSDGNN